MQPGNLKHRAQNRKYKNILELVFWYVALSNYSLFLLSQISTLWYMEGVEWVLSYKFSSYSLRSSPEGYIIFGGSIETSFAETLIIILETAGGSFRDLLSDDSVSVWGWSDPIMQQLLNIREVYNRAFKWLDRELASFARTNLYNMLTRSFKLQCWKSLLNF